MQLTKQQLYSIEVYINEWFKDSLIATKIWKDKSVISRLFKKYPKNWFSAEYVIQDRFDIKSINTSNHARIIKWSRLEWYILEKLKDSLSPEQISWRLELEENEKVCKDTIYEFIYENYPELVKKYFRRKGKKYRNRKQEQILQKYQIQERRMIDLRPEIVDKRARIWDWEWDTIIWKDRSWAILTLVERKTWFLMAYKLENGKQSEWVTEALQRLWKNVPKYKKKTLTFDNWREFADHKMMEFFTKVMIYFAHPYHSWERWTNENTNWLLREYIPKKTDFKTISQEELDKYVKKINSRPRKRLKYFTPYEMFHQKSCISE